tara:strand:+ start:191 stop:514 length:324 start_codon:yes stop_codon:yes gene_type:complete
MSNANTINRNLIPSNSQIEQATTIRKLAARLNALVAEMDAEDAERRSRGCDWQPVRADLPLVVEIKQEKTPTGRLRDEAYVPVRGIGCGVLGLSEDHSVTILRTVCA